MDEPNDPRCKKYHQASSLFIDHTDYYMLVDIPHTACAYPQCFKARCFSTELEEEYDVCAYHHFLRCQHCIEVEKMPTPKMGENEKLLPPHGLPVS